MQKSDWIPVSQLPIEMEYKGKKIGYSHHVLVFDGKSKYVSFYDYIDKEWKLAHGELEIYENSKPSHWMPLPENP